MQSYIEMYSEEAVYQMLEYKVPASVTLAQAIFESQSGGSELARKSNNHFGIKCHLEWGGDTVAKHDDTLNECFRKYRLVADSYTDHSMFLRSRARYASLFELPLDDYRSWCYGLKAAGYATYPSYAEDLITLIEQFRLHELDGYQSLDPVNIFNLRDPEIIPGPRVPDCSLQDLARSGILWTDEKDLLIQSLELLIESPAEPEEAVAEQLAVTGGERAKNQEFSDTGCDTAIVKVTSARTVEAIKPVKSEITIDDGDDLLDNITTGMVLPEEMKTAGPLQLPDPGVVTETNVPEKNDAPATDASAAQTPFTGQEQPTGNADFIGLLPAAFDCVKP